MFGRWWLWRFSTILEQCCKYAILVQKYQKSAKSEFFHGMWTYFWHFLVNPNWGGKIQFRSTEWQHLSGSPSGPTVTSPPPGCNGGGCSGIWLTPCSRDHGYSPIWLLPKVGSLRPGERPWVVRCYHSMLLKIPKTFQKIESQIQYINSPIK